MPTSRGGFEQSYNAQAAVDTQTMLVVALHVSQAPNDKREIAPILAKVGALPEELGQVDALLADTGYFSAANVNACEAQAIEPMLSMKRESHHIPVLSRWPKLPRGVAEAGPPSATRIGAAQVRQAPGPQADARRFNLADGAEVAACYLPPASCRSAM